MIEHPTKSPRDYLDVVDFLVPELAAPRPLSHRL